MKRTLLFITLFFVATPAFAADWAPADTASITLDASVVHDATPDYLSLAINCDQQPTTRAAIKEAAAQYLKDFKQIVGTDGAVRRNGQSIYASYVDPSVDPAQVPYSGTLSFLVRSVKPAAAVKIVDAVTEKGCTSSWDARILYTTVYAKQMKDELMEQIEQKKEFTEELLGVKLNKVNYLTFSTMPDYGSGYYGGGTSYDPESNTIQVITTLSVTFDISAKPATK